MSDDGNFAAAFGLGDGIEVTPIDDAWARQGLDEALDPAVMLGLVRKDEEEPFVVVGMTPDMAVWIAEHLLTAAREARKLIEPGFYEGDAEGPGHP